MVIFNPLLLFLYWNRPLDRIWSFPMQVNLWCRAIVKQANSFWQVLSVLEYFDTCRVKSWEILYTHVSDAVHWITKSETGAACLHSHSHFSVYLKSLKVTLLVFYEWKEHRKRGPYLGDRYSPQISLTMSKTTATKQHGGKSATTSTTL